MRSVAWRSKGPRNKGAVAIIIAMMMVAITGMGAVVVDLGHAWEVDHELQNAADAAALAGVLELDLIGGGTTQAHDQARRIAQAHVADGRPVALAANVSNDAGGDVVLGIWEFATRTWSAAAPIGLANAVLVRPARTGGGAVQTWFAGLLATNAIEVRGEAVAARNGPGCANAFPVAIPSCMLENTDGNVDCSNPVRLRLSPDKIDNSGLTSLSDDRSASVNVVRNLICEYDRAGACVIQLGAYIRLMNGNPMNAVRPKIEEMLDPDHDGTFEPVTVVVPVLRAPCPANVRYNRSHEVIGFADFRIENVTAPPNQYIEGSLVCGGYLRHSSGTDSEFYGLRGQPILVR